MATSLLVLCVFTYGSFALENIVSKTQTWVRMSSRYKDYVEKRITDGNRNQNIENCSHTNPRYGGDEAWVRVDLGRPFSIGKIIIYYRNDNSTSRFDKFYLDVSNYTGKTRCYEDQTPGLPPTIVNIDCQQKARYVRIGTNHSASGERPILEICEIEVWGCELNHYGEKCKFCGHDCKECDINSGCLKDRSSVCPVGYFGRSCKTHCYWCDGECTNRGACKRCKDGIWGRNCRKTCSPNCVQCNIHNGTCTKCKAGWRGKRCKRVCASGRYGTQCNYTCSSSCKDGRCDHVTGHCKTCVLGRKGDYCNETCRSGYYGESCLTRCSYGCKGNECSPVNGTCSHGCVDANLRNPMCSVCVSGYYKTTSQQDTNVILRCVECGHCKNEIPCDGDTGSCKDGCESGWRTQSCKTECHKGFFGADCRSRCSPNCKNRTCQPESGSCECKSGFTGHMCNECISGYYKKKPRYSNSFSCYPCPTHCKTGTVCNRSNGQCDYGCANGWKGQWCMQVCDQGFFGADCNKTCSPNCKSGICNPQSGYCTCRRGSIGHTCQACISGFYYKNGKCIECGHCKYKGRCSAQSGECTGGCNPGWSGIKCNLNCGNGTYGEGCLSQCSQHCLYPGCNHVSGDCKWGQCKSRWMGKKCDQCRKGYFGEDCRSRCSPNCKGGACQPESGSCECKNRFTGYMCQECVSGYYKKQSRYSDRFSCDSCSSHCKNGAVCNSSNGRCEYGCEQGWKGERCMQECGFGTYGEGCLSQCSTYCWYRDCDHVSGDCKSRRCKSGWMGRKCDQCNDRFYMSNGSCTACSSRCKRRLCNKSNGRCTDGCIAGWSGLTCNERCPSGSYGKDCSKRCRGECLNNKTCHTINGICTNGCMPGYEGQFCDQTCTLGKYGLKCALTCSGRCNNGTSCDPKNGYCSGGCIPGWYQPECHKACKDGLYGFNCRMKCSMNCMNGSTCLHTNGTCLQGCNPGFKGHDCMKISVSILSSLSESSPAAIGSATGVALMVLISIIIGFIIYRSRRGKTIIKAEQRRSNRGTTDICTTTLNNAATGSLREDTNDVLYYNEMNIAKDVLVTELSQVILNLETDTCDGFEKEFKVLPFGERFECSTAKLLENMQKNRFKTTFPYDHSRVVLGPNGPYTSDYINANYIEDMFGQRLYIACQGPRANTVLDHWRLIWQEKICKIVMLTGLIENQRVKCEQYWPNKNSDMIHGQWIIKLTEEKKYANYVIRQLEVADQSNKEKRMITHFHYTQWPDHGTPDPVHLVTFYRHVVRTGTGNVPLLVHCSAGLGRTGTFIALDALSRYGTMNGKVNVPEYVKVMRKDRMNMVQNSDQYAFLYHALHESFNCEAHILKREEVANSTEKGRTGTYYRVEFDKLKTLKPVYKERDFCAGRENRSLNFTQDILPLDKYRVYLPITVPGQGDYYNAVVLPSFTRPSAIIAAQFPVAAHGVDLARLLVNMEVELLISTSDLSNIKSISEWVNNRTGTIDLKHYRISKDSCEMLSDEIRKTVLTVQELESDVTQKVQCLELMSWKMDKKTPPDSNCIIEVIRYIETQRLTLPDSCVSVMSKDGASGCGLMCAMYNASQQLSMDDEVDVFSIVRQLQIRQPEMFSSYEEYEFFYKTLQKYLTSDNIYANT